MNSQVFTSRNGRRRFFSAAGAAAAASTLAACNMQSAPAATPTPAPATPGTAGPAATVRPTTTAPFGPGKPMYQMDAQHTGRSPYAGPRQVTLARSFDFGSVETPNPGNPSRDIQSSAAIGPDGTVYIGNHMGNLVALRDPGSGTALTLHWKFHPDSGSSFHGTPAIGRDGTVYIHFAAGGGAEALNTLYALKAPATGSEVQVVWSVDLGPGQAGGPTGNSPTLGPDDTIYAVSGGGRLSAVAPDGTVKWSAPAGPAVKVAPALAADGTVYTTSLDGKLYAIAPPAAGAKEGTTKWTFDFGQNLGPTPLVTAPVTGPPTRGQDGVGSGAAPTIGPDGTIYVGANNSNFYAIAPDGKRKWLFEAERELAGIWTAAALSADNSTLYFGANKGGIYAVRAADGSLRWRHDIFGSVYSSPALDNGGLLFTGSSIGHVLGIDAASGRAVFDFDANAGIWTAPAIRHDGSLVVGDRNGRVMLLAPR